MIVIIVTKCKKLTNGWVFSIMLAKGFPPLNIHHTYIQLSICDTQHVSTGTSNMLTETTTAFDAFLAKNHMCCNLSYPMELWYFRPRLTLILLTNVFLLKIPTNESCFVQLSTTVVQPVIIFSIQQTQTFPHQDIFCYAMWCVVKSWHFLFRYIRSLLDSWFGTFQCLWICCVQIHFGIHWVRAILQCMIAWLNWWSSHDIHTILAFQQNIICQFALFTSEILLKKNLPPGAKTKKVHYISFFLSKNLSNCSKIDHIPKCSQHYCIALTTRRRSCLLKK